MTTFIAHRFPTAAAIWRAIKIGCGLLAVYVGVYVILSWNGGYTWTQSGQVRYGFGLSVTDLEQWQPRFCFCQRFKTIDGSWITRANALGYTFAPLILLDQTYIHPTVRIFDPLTGEPIKTFHK